MSGVKMYQRDGVRPCGQKVFPWRGKGQAVHGD